MTTRAPGEMLDGRYRLTEKIGSGGMGTVYRAHDTRLDRTVAVKLIHPGREVPEVTRARLQAEARLAGALHHPGIVQVYDYGEADEPTEPDGTTPYIVMQHVDGTPLSAVLRERGALPAETVGALLGDLAEALEVAHAAGIVHRDLKPSNILVGTTGRAVLVDFGVARSDTTEPLTETGQIIGSADYLSPEQVRGQRAMPPSDIYALGIVAHQCLSAASPFRRETQAATLLARLHDDAPSLGPEVPAPLRDLVGAMMAAGPSDRPTATEVAARVTTLDQHPTRVLPPPPAARPAGRATPAPRRDRRRLVAIVAAAALLLTIGTVVVVIQGDDATPPAGAADLVVPNVRGVPVARAVRKLDVAGFDVVRRQVDGPAPAGEVRRQSPGPGTYTGDDPPTVTLRVASGWVDLDDATLLGATYAAAAAAVTDLGLTPVRAERASGTGLGTVLTVGPDGRVRVGSPVTLTVATAAATSPSGTGPTHHAKPRTPKKHHAKGHQKHGKKGHQKHHHGKPGHAGKHGKHGKPGKKRH